MDGDRKGHYTKLENGFRAILTEIGEENELLAAEPPTTSRCFPFSPERPPLFEFDFVEVCGGVGKVSDSMRSLGHTVLQTSTFHTLKSTIYEICGWVKWVVHMIQQKLFKSDHLAPHFHLLLTLRAEVTQFPKVGTGCCQRFFMETCWHFAASFWSMSVC